MTGVDYDKRLYAGYHAGRAHDESVMQLWRETIRRCVGDRSELTVLDLGCGTGRFSSLLADELGSSVIGVEPSDRMRTVAQEECRHPRVRFLKGTAEQIPLLHGSCDVAWLSQVIHHLSDIAAAANELQRVMTSSGLVIIRSNFKGRLDGFCRYYEFFPSGLVVDEARHPSLDQVRSMFESSGFFLERHETLQQMEARSLKQYAHRIRQRTYSTFELISDEDFAAGLLALERAARQQRPEQPVMAKIDLLVFRRA